MEIEFRKFPALIVKRNSPAAVAMMRICQSKVKPGSVHFVSQEEYESLLEDVVELEI